MWVQLLRSFFVNFHVGAQNELESLGNHIKGHSRPNLTPKLTTLLEFPFKHIFK